MLFKNIIFFVYKNRKLLLGYKCFFFNFEEKKIIFENIYNIEFKLLFNSCFQEYFFFWKNTFDN